MCYLVLVNSTLRCVLLSFTAVLFVVWTHTASCQLWLSCYQHMLFDGIVGSANLKPHCAARVAELHCCFMLCGDSPEVVSMC